MLNLVIFGGPGSGKGTQSELIAKQFDLLHISTGDVLREEIANGTELGKTIDTFISKGELIPDELMIEILSSVIDQSPKVKGVIFDGFPRTLPQAEALEKMLAEKSNGISLVVALDVTEETLVARLLKRGEVSGRSDDNPEAIKIRLEVYHQKTQPILNYFEERNLLHLIPGEGTIEDIFGRITATIEKL